MRKRATPVTAILLVFMSCVIGCRAKQLHRDQAEIRGTLLKLYEDQVMDNLIRTKNYLPVVQIDYSKITGTIEHNAGGEAGGSQQVTDSSYGSVPEAGPAPAAATFPIRRAVQDIFNFKATASQKNQLTITGEPVIASNDVYDAYLEFLAVPDRLCEGEKLPPKLKDVHLWRKFREKYYWIPKQHAPKFFRLFLVTTIQRGQPVSRPSFFESVVGAVVSSRQVEGSPTGYHVRLRLKKPVPNDSGELRVVLDGQERRFRIQPIAEVDLKKPTEVIEILHDEAEEPPLTIAALTKAIENKEAQVTLENVRPGVVKTDDLLKDLHDTLELLRLQEFSR